MFISKTKSTAIMKGIDVPMGKLEKKETVYKIESSVQTIVNDENTDQTEQPHKIMQGRSESTNKLKQRSYYLTDKLQKAITIKTAEGDLDKSGVVREALKLYLADILKNI